jgi:hypothetical protein
MNRPNGIEVTADGTIVASGPDGVKAYDILAMRTALRLEIRTGMVMRNGYSLVQACIKRGYVPAGVRTKKSAYIYLDRLAASLPGQASKPLDGPR